MTILRERVTWRRTRTEPKTRYATLDLTQEEREHVRVAFRFLRRRYGSNVALAAALQASPRSLSRVMGTRGKPSAGILMRAAKLAGMPLERILAGKYPKRGTCPGCGLTRRA